VRGDAGDAGGAGGAGVLDEVLAASAATTG